MAAAPASAAISRRPAPRIYRLGPAPPRAQPQPPAQNWSWDGGTAIVVAQGETLDTISRRHGVPAACDHAGEQHDACGAAAARPAPGDPARAAPDGCGPGRVAAGDPRRRSGELRAARARQRAYRRPGRDDLFAGAALSADPDGDREGEQCRPRSSREGRRPRRHSGHARRAAHRGAGAAAGPAGASRALRRRPSPRSRPS